MKAICLYLIFSIFIIPACTTRKACSRKFPPVLKDSVKEVYKTVTVYRDTTIFVHLPGDTLYLETSAQSQKVSKLTSGLAISEAWISNGVLKHKLVQSDTILPFTLTNALSSTISHHVKERITAQEVKKETPWWQELKFNIDKLLLIIILCYIVIRLFKNLIPL